MSLLCYTSRNMNEEKRRKESNSKKKKYNSHITKTQVSELCVTLFTSKAFQKYRNLFSVFLTTLS